MQAYLNAPPNSQTTELQLCSKAPIRVARDGELARLGRCSVPQSSAVQNDVTHSSSQQDGHNPFIPFCRMGDLTIMKATVGVCKKIGLPDYGSIGITCDVELDLNQTLFQDDPELFH